MNSIHLKHSLIVQRMRDRRTALKFTQAYVASKLGISQNAYSKIEAGLTNFNIERLYAIAEVLQVDIKELL